MTFSPDPKPRKRIKNPQAGVEKVRRESRCRACGLVSSWVMDGGNLTRAHLLNRSQGGDDVDDCIIPLCGHGSQGCHGAMDGQTHSATDPSLLAGLPWHERCTRAIRQRVKETLTDEEVQYLVGKRGEYWFGHLFVGKS